MEGLTRLVSILRAVVPASVIMALTPIPRQDMSASHHRVFAGASAIFGEAVTSCGGLALNVVDVVIKALVGDADPTAAVPGRRHCRRRPLTVVESTMSYRL